MPPPTVTFTMLAASPQTPSARITSCSRASSRSFRSRRRASRSGRKITPRACATGARLSRRPLRRTMTTVIFLGRFAEWRGSFAGSRDLERREHERTLSYCPVVAVRVRTCPARSGEPRTITDGSRPAHLLSVRSTGIASPLTMWPDTIPHRRRRVACPREPRIPRCQWRWTARGAHDRRRRRASHGAIIGDGGRRVHGRWRGGWPLRPLQVPAVDRRSIAMDDGEATARIAASASPSSSAAAA